MADNNIAQYIAKHAEAFEGFKSDVYNRIDELELTFNRKGFGGVGGPAAGNSEKLRNEADKAFRAAIRHGDPSSVRDFAVQNAMSVGSDPDGGYLVIPYYSDEMTKTELATSPIRDLCRVVTIETDEFEEPIDRNAGQAVWVSETGSRAATSTPELGIHKIPVHEIYSCPEITQKLMEDGRNVPDWLLGKSVDDFNTATNLSFVSGNGRTQPKGILTCDKSALGDATRTWGQLQYFPTGVSGNFAGSGTGADALFDAIYGMKAGYRSGARWLMNSTTAGRVRKLKDAEGRYLWVDSLQEGEPDRLCGYPVRCLEDMPDVAADSYSLAFANLKRAYVIVDRLGIRLLIDPYTSKPNVLFYQYRRIGGDVVNSEAIKLVKFGVN